MGKQFDQPAAAMTYHPPYLMMPIRQSNGLGVFGLLVALFGLIVPTGIIAILGLAISLIAVGRSPRTAAAFGVFIGLVGTIFWLVIDAIVLAAVIVGMTAAAVGTVVTFALAQPEAVELTSDMANIAIAAQYHQKQHRDGAVPASLDDLDLPLAGTIDPWGNRYQLVASDHDPGFSIISAGPDGIFDTDDDVTLANIGDVWKDAMASFEMRAGRLGEMLAVAGESGKPFNVRAGEFTLTMENGNISITGIRSGSCYPITLELNGDAEQPSTLESIRKAYWTAAAQDVDAQQTSADDNIEKE